MRVRPTTALGIWRERVGGGTRGLTDVQVEAAALLAVEAEARGEVTCAWHVAAIVTGGRCCCAMPGCKLERDE